MKYVGRNCFHWITRIGNLVGGQGWDLKDQGSKIRAQDDV